ncbi:MAG: PspC domain-containing protein [Deltaproteobacteria bacterium]|nr:PspC domain-containing protein [Deltaproteobacteria bacterium]
MPEGPNEIVISSHKPFRRSSKHRIIAGVCGGLGEYFELDPVIFRLGFVFLAITSFGWGILIYIILWIAVPLQKSS